MGVSSKVATLPVRSKRPAWFQAAEKDHRGKVIPNLANVMLALRATPELSSAFVFDEMRRAALLCAPLPSTADGSAAGEADDCPRPIRDADVSQLQEWLQRSGLPRIGAGLTHQAVDLLASERRSHPVREYLERLSWDGIHRLEDWLRVYLGAQPSTYHSKIGRFFLIAMVARIFEPGCKADYMLVLEGPQGSRKSTACKILGGEWFSDSMPDVTSGKDVSMHLRGKWLIEVAEMSALRRTEAAALKAFITRPVEIYRPSYGRKEVHEDRQCIFIGTTNKSIYLQDETGGRRFWPVKVGKIDTGVLSRDRDQLFAEAMMAWHARKPWWPDPAFEREHIAPQQAARFEADAWSEPICAYLAARETVTVGEIAKNALKLEPRSMGSRVTSRITAVMEHAGWRRSQEKNTANSYLWARL